MGVVNTCCERITLRTAKRPEFAFKGRPHSDAWGVVTSQTMGLLRKHALKPWLKPMAGLVLLVGLFTSLDTEALLKQLASAQLGWFLIGLIAAIAANLLCSLRWQNIARGCELGLATPWMQWAKLYFQGISINSVLPGGIVGGDVWRASQFKPFKSSGQAVFLERLAGLWGLFFISFGLGLTGLLMFTDMSESPETRALSLPWTLTTLYTSALGLACLAPLAAPWLFPRKLGDALNLKLLTHGLGLSLVSQALTVIAFWACLKSAGLDLPFWLVGWLGSLIFLSALVPASIGGFGARELGATILLGGLSTAPEAAAAGSILFGLTATFQGLIGLVFWLTDRKRPEA
jgi:uncharacterized membrane protein YbhN (UPF0104 family)